MNDIKKYLLEEINHFKKCGCQMCGTRIETLNDVLKYIEKAGTK